MESYVTTIPFFTAVISFDAIYIILAKDKEFLKYKAVVRLLMCVVVISFQLESSVK